MTTGKALLNKSKIYQSECLSFLRLGDCHSWNLTVCPFASPSVGTEANNIMSCRNSCVCVCVCVCVSCFVSRSFSGLYVCRLVTAIYFWEICQCASPKWPYKQAVWLTAQTRKKWSYIFYMIMERSTFRGINIITS